MKRFLHLLTLFFKILVEKNLEKIIGILLWATSLVHHVRFLLTSLYRDLYSIPATNYSIPPTQWEYFLRLLNDSATITVKNSLHLPLEAKVVEFRHSTITAKDQLPIDLPIDRHVWVRIRDPNCEKRKLSFLSKDTLQWSKKSLLPLLSSIPLHRTTSLTVTAAADAFADETEMGIGGWVSIGSSTFWFSHTTWTSRHSYRFQNPYRGTSPPGKLWHNFASSSWSTPSVPTDPGSSTSNPDQITRVLRQI